MVKAELRDHLLRYQKEAAQVLWQAFRPQILADSPGPADGAALAQLQQIAEMGRAITAMAEQQIELQRRQQHLDERLNRAGQVVRAIQGELGEVQVRLGVLEDRLHPATYITEAQAAEVSNLVKALAEFLIGKDKAKNHYQGIFGELYRRFGVASYKLIRVEQHAAVLAFLEDWRRAGAGEPPAPSAGTATGTAKRGWRTAIPVSFLIVSRGGGYARGFPARERCDVTAHPLRRTGATAIPRRLP